MGGRTEFSNSIDAEEVTEALAHHEFPDSITPLLDTYEETVGDRDRLFWRWLDTLFPAFTLSCVDPQRVGDVHTAKLLASIYVTVLDDLAEKHDDRQTFEEAAKVPFDHQSPDLDRSGVDENVVGYVNDLWARYTEVPKGSRATEYRELLLFDLRQVISAIEYSYLVNHHLSLLSENQLWACDVHNMAVFIYTDLDLMCSPSFDPSDLSFLREVVIHTERIARICNWIMTWERELHEGDCSSWVIAYALTSGIVSMDDLQALREDPREENVRPVIQGIHDHDVEDLLRQRLHEEFEAAEARGRQVTSVDIDAYLEGFQTVREFHEASKTMLY